MQAVSGGDDRATTRRAESTTQTAADGAEHALRPSLIYLTAAVLGFTFFALELVWYRMLAPILGGTAFTFGLILCMALLGIGMGGLAYEFVFERRKPSWSALAITCGCEAIFAIFPFVLGDRLAVLAAYYRGSVPSFLQLVAGWSVVTAIVVLPVALVSGLQFPLMVALLGRGRSDVSRHLGMTYFWNTMGAITGSLVAGFGAMPLLTAPGLWQAVAVLLAGLSLAILVAGPSREVRSTSVVVGLAAATFASLFAEGPTAAWRHSGIGVGRAVNRVAGSNVMRQWMNEHRQSLVWEADGIESSIGIGCLDGLSFVVNGKSDGNSLSDSATQVGLAIIGAVLHKEPKTALVIGLGTGETAGWLAEVPGIERVDVIELEPAIDEMARRCRELNFDVLNHRRVRRIYNDGREFVLTTKNRYDLVVSEPSNPYRAGVAALYTTEFYGGVRKCLNPGGLFVQWLQAYDVDARTVRTVLSTAGAVFPHVEVWQTMPDDLQLVCSATPLEYTTEQVRRRIATPPIQQALVDSWKVHDLEGFLARFVAAEGWAAETARRNDIPRNTDDRTVLEYRFAKTVGVSVPFSVEAVRKQLKELGLHQRPMPGDPVDWNTVEIRRQEFNLLFRSEPSSELLIDSADIAYIEALKAYRRNDFAAAVKAWPAKYRDSATELQRMLLAHSLAELARPECLELVASLESQFPTEAAAITAVFNVRTGDAKQATEALEKFYAELRRRPWIYSSVADAALLRTAHVAHADHEAATKLFAILAQPLASHRYEFSRHLVRFIVARKLGANHVVEALAELEPHIRWTADVLQARAEAYAAVDHPLAPRAERDWREFQRNAPAQ